MRIPPQTVLALLLTLSAYATPDPKTDYARMQKWQFSPAVTLSAPVTFTRDTATWTLESGTIRRMEPLSDGTSSGIVFEGRGRFRMTVPDRYELKQLHRFVGKPIEVLDQPITQLFLRTSEAALIDLFPTTAEQYTPFGPAKKRQEAWLVDLRIDPDSGVLMAKLNPGAVRTVIGMDTEDYGWITYDYDSARDEEISLTHYQARVYETWLSLDAPEHRRPDGRPGEFQTTLATLDHIDVKADLTRNGKNTGVSRHNQRSINGRYVVEATFTGVADAVRALRLNLWSRAENLKAFDTDGNELPVFRDHVGQRSSFLDDRTHDDDFVLVLSTPLQRGEQQRVRFEYELETANYAPGGLWYPMFRDALDQKHTARLELTVRKRNELRSMGKMESRTEDGATETSVWVVAQPTKVVTF
ncbi:MAG: hypothetical protein ACLGH0_06470, partial [Thermoanaerobaculia bacterium]